MSAVTDPCRPIRLGQLLRADVGVPGRHLVQTPRGDWTARSARVPGWRGVGPVPFAGGVPLIVWVVALVVAVAGLVFTAVRVGAGVLATPVSPGGAAASDPGGRPSPGPSARATPPTIPPQAQVAVPAPPPSAAEPSGSPTVALSAPVSRSAQALAPATAAVGLPPLPGFIPLRAPDPAGRRDAADPPRPANAGTPSSPSSSSAAVRPSDPSPATAVDRAASAPTTVLDAPVGDDAPIVARATATDPPPRRLPRRAAPPARAEPPAAVVAKPAADVPSAEPAVPGRPDRLVAIVDGDSVLVPDARGIPERVHRGARLPSGARLVQIDAGAGLVHTDRGLLRLE